MALLPTVIYLLERLRRTLNKTGRGLLMIADVFAEAMHDWRQSKRKYPHAE